MSQINHKKWLSYRNGLYLMYHVMKGRKDKRKGREMEVVVEELPDNAAVSDAVPIYSCSMCGQRFNLLSSFLLHVYRHSDPCAIQKDIKKEEELENQEFSYLKDVGVIEEPKKEEGIVIKQEITKTEEISGPAEAPVVSAVQCLPLPVVTSSNVSHSSPNFLCHYCNNSFSSKKTLKQHLSLHKNYFDHQYSKTHSEMCDICLTKLPPSESIKEHFFKSHKRTSRICRICKCHLGSNALRKTHERFYHEIKDLDCVSCKIGFTSIKEIVEHTFNTHKNENRCIFCGESFGCKREMIEHVVDIHTTSVTKVELESLKLLSQISDKTDTHKCSYCSKIFSNQKLARLHETRQHLTSTEDDPGYTCHICDTSFNKRANGLRHARRMHGIRVNKSDVKDFPCKIPNDSSFTCDQCNKTFPNSGALISHSRNTHTTQELIFQCGVCEKRLKSFKSLREHIEGVHEKRLIFFCDVCGKGYPRKSALRTHIKVNHIITRDHVCPICQQKFAQVGQLNVHQKIHSTKKCHTCSICQKSFAQLSGLHQHSSMHSTIPKYFCAICQLSFKYASSFYNHRKSHLPSTDYKCSDCNRQCPSRFSLYTHRKTHHAVITPKFDCSECGKIFKRKDTLKHHILNKHTPHVNYKCEYCDTGFKSKRDRKYHMNTIHMQLL